jgi:PqqD family protein of HPr-rel-A system
MRVRAEPAAALRIMVLDSLTALYHRRSGQTHLLAAPLPEILAIIGDEWADLPTLLLRLQIDDDAEARAILTSRLHELIEIGLVALA